MSVTSVRYTADGWGVGELWLDGERVVQHELPRPTRGAGSRAAVPDGLPNHPRGGARLPLRTLSGTSARAGDGFATSLVSRLQAFFAGDAVDFDDVELDTDGVSPFQRALGEALRSIGRGEVVTYGELAALAGRPGAARAAGTFCAQNRFAVFVPCHRVVGAGGIGGYGDLGVEYKRRLLALEGVGAR